MGNIFRCAVRRQIDLSTSQIFSLRNEWFLLFAQGNVSKGIPIHHENRTASFDAIDFLTDYSVKQPNELLDPVGYKMDEPLLVTDVITDNECGVTKNCFTDCKSGVCTYIVSWLTDGTDVIFNMTAKVESGTGDQAWLGVGFSPDGRMPRSSLLVCMNLNGQFHGQYGYSLQYEEYHPVLNETPAVISGGVYGDVLHCSMRRPVVSTSERIFDLSKEWHILFARGHVYDSRYNYANGEPQPEYHSFRVGGNEAINFLTKPGVSTEQPKPEKNSAIIEPDKECGVSKGCFGNCTNNECTYLVSWWSNSSDITFSLSAKINRVLSGPVNTAWIGVGFSHNGHMPNSSFLLCMNGDGTFYGQYGYSLIYKAYYPITNISVATTETSSNGDVIRCTLTRPIDSNSNHIFNLTTPWYLLFAYGQVTVSQNGPPTAQHHDFKVSGNDKIDFLTIQNVTTTVAPETTSSGDTTPNNPPTILPDSECGVTKSCFSDCKNDECNYLVSWSSDSSDVSFSLSAKIDSSLSGPVNTAWVGIGFSHNGQMPNSSFVLCMNAEGNFYGQYGYSQMYRQYFPITDISIGVSDTSTSGNILRCTFKRPIVSHSDHIFNLTSPWYILFAYGQVTPSSNGPPTAQHHDFRIGGSEEIDFLKISKVTTTVTPDTTSSGFTTPQAGQITLDPECGKTKGCFPQCSGSTCSSLVTWQKDNNYVLFEIAEDVSRSPIDRWIAIGFSANQKMGDTSVVMCQNKGSGDSSVVLGYNDDKNFQILNSPNSNVLIDGSMTIDGNVMRCVFRRAITSSDPKVFNFTSDWYMLMGNGPIVGGTPTHHEDTPISTSSKVNMQDFSMAHGGVQTLLHIKIHGCLMIVAWVMLSSIGIILARYFKQHWSDSTCMKLKIWFQIHRSCMALTVLLTMGGFILMMVENEGYRELKQTGVKSFVNYHPIFGVVVFSLAVLNPIIALFRCAPDHEHRPIFNWFHSIVGTSAHILGAITVGFGLNIPKANVDSTANSVIIAFAISFIVVEFLLIRLSHQHNTPADQKVLNLSGSADKDSTGGSESGAMKFVLFIHVIAMSTCCGLLLYFVIKS